MVGIVFTPIKLKAEWLGHKKGSILSLNESAAQSLLKRGAAVLVEKEKQKDIPSPPKDKMMKPVRQKRVAREY